jgi:exonuclease III
MSKKRSGESKGDASPNGKVARKEKRSFYERSDIQPLPLDNPADYVKIVSWNVAGLRSFYGNSKGETMKRMLETHAPDIVILQETKLQSSHVEEADAFFQGLGYKGYWACSMEKKGYSGTALLVKSSTATDQVQVVKQSQHANSNSKQKTLGSFFGAASKGKSKQKSSTDSAENAVDTPGLQPSSDSNKWKLLKVVCDIDDSKHGGEGRVICAELDSFFLVGCYVPNSGQELVRLDYRINEWDTFMRNYLNTLRKSKPVIFAGDLNVGYLDLDIYNFDAKHIHKQASLTPEERASHAQLISEGYIDALRFFYPGK